MTRTSQLKDPSVGVVLVAKEGHQRLRSDMLSGLSPDARHLHR